MKDDYERIRCLFCGVWSSNVKDLKCLRCRVRSDPKRGFYSGLVRDHVQVRVLNVQTEDGPRDCIERIFVDPDTGE